MLHTLLQPRPKPAPALGALPAGEGEEGGFFPQEGEGACTPRRSASEQTLGAEAAGGSPGKPSHSSSLPGRGRGAPKETSSSFKNMVRCPHAVPWLGGRLRMGCSPAAWLPQACGSMAGCSCCGQSPTNSFFYLWGTLSFS